MAFMLAGLPGFGLETMGLRSKPFGVDLWRRFGV